MTTRRHLPAVDVDLGSTVAVTTWGNTGPAALGTVVRIGAVMVRVELLERLDGYRPGDVVYRLPRELYAPPGAAPEDEPEDELEDVEPAPDPDP